MTADLTEIGLDGRGVLWRPHLLTDVLEARGAVALAREPVLLKRGDPAAAPFKVTSDAEGLSWKWGQWKKLQVADGRGGARTYSAPQRPVVRWADLPVGDDFELTFYDADDTPGGVVKVETPRAAAFGRDVKFVQRGGAVVVSLLKRVARARVYVEVLEPGQTRDAASGQGAIRRDVVTFRPGDTTVRVPLKPFTIIAAVSHLGGRRELLGYVSYNGSDPVAGPNLSLAMDAELLEKVRGWVGEGEAAPREGDLTPEEWTDNWPRASRARFARLAEHAVALLGLSAAEAGRLLREHPAGLARFLALVACGYTHQGVEQSVRGLDGGSFPAALGALAPHLTAALPSLASTEEKGWAVRHAHNRCLDGAAAWAGGQGADALARALHLIEIRADAVAAWEARSRRRAAETASP